jgi:AraC-like DNA-binding protein
MLRVWSNEFVLNHLFQFNQLDIADSFWIPCRSIPMQTGNNLVAGATLSPFKCVSTDGVRALERPEFWADGARLLFGTVQVEVPSREAFNASVEYTNLADVTFCRLSTRGPHHASRSEAVARNDSRAFIKAVLQREGSSVLEQNGHRTVLHAGEWSMYDAEKPYRVEAFDRCGLSILLMPRDKVVPRNFDIGKVVLRRFSGRRGVGKLIWNLISTTFEQIPEIQDRSTQEVTDILAQMIRLAILDGSKESTPANARETLRERVKLYISSHLADPELSIAKIASMTRCTKRYLHMVFEPEQISLSDYILERRLDRCRQDLVNPSCAHKSITEIAYSWGFNNSNHFSRCFRRAFGAPPRRFRSEFGQWSSENLAAAVDVTRGQKTALDLPRA